MSVGPYMTAHQFIRTITGIVDTLGKDSPVYITTFADAAKQQEDLP